MEKSTHKVEVIKVDRIEKHPNADTLEIVYIWNYTYCGHIGEFKIGDLAAYCPPDSLVPTSRAEFAHLKREGEDYARIKAKKLRGVFSQGLLVPAPEGSREGDDVAELLGVLHYEAPCVDGASGGICAKAPKRKLKEGTLGELIAPVYDIDSGFKYASVFEEGEEVCSFEKIHGCVARDTLIETLEHGLLAIKKIVEEKMNVHVKCLNHETGEIEYSLVEDWSKLPSNKDWYEIETEDGTKLRITGEHPVWLPELRCYRKVADLEEGDEILMRKEEQ